MQDIEKAIQDIVKTQAAQAEQIKTLFNQLDDVKKLAESVQDMALSMRDLTAAQRSMDSKVTKLNADMDEMKLKPAKRWDSVTMSVVTAIVTAAITFYLTAVGLK